MDQTTGFKSGLEIIGVTNLTAVSLRDLDVKVDNAGYQPPHRGQFLLVYTGWFSGRLVTLDLSDVAQVERETSEWCNSLSARGYERHEVLDTFRYCQTLEAQTDPLSTRRFQLAAVEIANKFPPSTMSQVSSNNPSAQRVGSDQHDFIEIKSSSSNGSVEFLGQRSRHSGGSEKNNGSESMPKGEGEAADSHHQKGGPEVIHEGDSPRSGGSEEMGVPPKTLKGDPGPNYTCHRCGKAGEPRPRPNRACPNPPNRLAS